MSFPLIIQEVVISNITSACESENEHHRYKKKIQKTTFLTDTTKRLEEQTSTFLYMLKTKDRVQKLSEKLEN